MDISGNDGTNVEPQWQVNAQVIDSFCPQIYAHAHDQNLGFCDVNVPRNDASTSSGFGPVRTDMFWTPNSMLRGSSMFLPSVPATIPPSLPHLPVDSGFIERAARFSCFNGGSSIDILNGFNNIPGPSNPYPQHLQGSKEAFGALPGMQHHMTEAYKEATPPGKNDEERDGAGLNGCGDQEEEMQGESSSKGHENAKKRKRAGQDMECEENKGASQRSMETADDNTTGSTKAQRGKSCKAGSQGSEPPKEGYIHIRARRGQATNSHSLAERVRREKISERMKFLQDLVPGCSKVTGKAVMLDEIINYVQSLQRQVEFLSMKLATVNPRLDFNLETLIAKDMLPPRPGLPPSSLAFPPNMHLPFPPLHHSQPGLVVQAGLTSLCSNSSETLHRLSNLLPTTSGFKEAMSKVPNVWEDELHNVVHMGGFDSTTPLNSQDLSGSVPSSSMKAEQP